MIKIRFIIGLIAKSPLFSDCLQHAAGGDIDTTAVAVPLPPPPPPPSPPHLVI
ncbi:MAG TPA: hypothetical protein VE524_05050 [Nitrososphaeraceae archaeon]|jgi:hypothetical protein|nr:hypothetical protein [Nitrososphaeraceae archaeon]